MTATFEDWMMEDPSVSYTAHIYWLRYWQSRYDKRRRERWTGPFHTPQDALNRASEWDIREYQILYPDLTSKYNPWLVWHPSDSPSEGCVTTRTGPRSIPAGELRPATNPSTLVSGASP